ncbi:MAG: hypothetical protein K8T90_06240 [Planctomycetes bacterium]|nr:hypothetical protein [Planctomycetota bacterium]
MAVFFGLAVVSGNLSPDTEVLADIGDLWREPSTNEFDIGDLTPGYYRNWNASNMPLLWMACVLLVLAPSGLLDRARRWIGTRPARAGGPVSAASTVATRRIASGVGPTSRIRAVVLVIWTVAIASQLILVLIGWNSFMRTGFRPSIEGGVPMLAVALCLAFVTLTLRPLVMKGRVVVSWTDSPQRVGGPVTFCVGTSPRAANIDRACVHLRCVRESPRAGFMGRLGFRERTILWTRPAADSFDARTRTGAPAADRFIGPTREIRARFDPPANLPGTDMWARDATMWEILVVGDVGSSAFARAVPVTVAPA